MLMQILTTMSSYNTPVETTPAFIAAAVASLNAGVCNTVNHTVTTSAQVRLTWAANNFLTAAHVFRVYQDGVFVAQYSAVQPHDKTVVGKVEKTDGSGYQQIWVFRVDIVRIVDNVVLASSSPTFNTTWTKNYDSCRILL